MEAHLMLNVQLYLTQLRLLGKGSNYYVSMYNAPERYRPR